MCVFGERGFQHGGGGVQKEDTEYVEAGNVECNAAKGYTCCGNSRDVVGSLNTIAMVY